MAAIMAATVMSCANDKTVLSGVVPQDSDAQVQVMCRSLKIDTLITPAKGKFSVDLPLDKMTTAIARYDGKTAQFVLDGERVTVDFATDEAQVYAQSKGATAALVEFQKWNADYRQRYPKASTEEERKAMMDEYRDKMKEVAAANESVVGLMAVKSVKPLLEPAEMREFVATLSPVIQEEESIVDMLKVMAAQEATAIGKMFTDFEIPQTDGSVVKLSDFVGKGKYILADFWASWCGPCKREIPNLKKTYAKFHGKDFDVISIAVWDKPEDTLKAIEEEDLKWGQIINCQRIPGELYGIEGIPTMILFGPDGTILERGGNLRGANMEATIAKYLNK